MKIHFIFLFCLPFLFVSCSENKQSPPVDDVFLRDIDHFSPKFIFDTIRKLEGGDICLQGNRFSKLYPWVSTIDDNELVLKVGIHKDCPNTSVMPTTASAKLVLHFSSEKDSVLLGGEVIPADSFSIIMRSLERHIEARGALNELYPKALFDSLDINFKPLLNGINQYLKENPTFAQEDLPNFRFYSRVPPQPPPPPLDTTKLTIK